MELLHKALIALIQDHPFDQITIDDIVQQAKIGRSTFYRHYATKDELINDIALNEIDQLFDLTFPLLLSVGSRESSIALVSYVDGRRELWRALLTGGAVGLMREAFIKRSIAKATTSSGDMLDLELPVDLAAAYGVAATVEVLSWWLRQSEFVPIELVAGYLDRLAVRPALIP